MKKSILVAGAAAMIAVVSCKKAETTEMEKVDTTQTAVVVPAEEAPIVTDSTASTAVQHTENALDKTGAAIENGAEKTGNAIEKGLDKTGAALEKGADKVKDAAHDATDGDGHLTK